MAENSKIEWTDDTWNPTIGCTVLSPGCTNCYAMKMAGRLEAMGQPAYQGHTIKTKAGFVWNGKVAASNWGQMIKPLSWKKPRRVFVNSMSDLFHEDMPDEVIDQVFAIMARCPQHTFQVLTKRASRMATYMRDRTANAEEISVAIEGSIPGSGGTIPPGWKFQKGGSEYHSNGTYLGHDSGYWEGPLTLPLPNVWLGVSVEDQRRADDRIPHLLATPAAVRFLSCEPLLGPVSLTAFLWATGPTGLQWHLAETERRLVIVGGESGPNARPYCYEWAQSIIDQCAAADVACFHKQVGAHPIGFDGRRVHLKDRKGGDPELWPQSLRVRQMPQPAGGVG